MYSRPLYSRLFMESRVVSAPLLCYESTVKCPCCALAPESPLLQDGDSVDNVCIFLSRRDSKRHRETISPGGGAIFATLKLPDISGACRSVGRQLVYHRLCVSRESEVVGKGKGAK